VTGEEAPDAVHLEFMYVPDEIVAASKLASKLPRSAGTRSGRRSVFGWLLFVGLAVILFQLLNNQSNRSSPPAGSPVSSPSPPANSREGFLEILLPFGPWLLIFGVIWFFVFRQLRNSARKALAENPQFQQLQVLDMDAQGVRLATPLASTQWKWASFSRMTETAELLLLQLPERAFLVIPKRAFSGPEQEAKLRRIVAENLHEHTGAFPVLMKP
jgi:hypothetical protein